MNFRNAFLFTAQIISKIDNIETQKNIVINIEEMRCFKKSSFVRHLTDFDKDKNFILVNGKKAPVGTILKRPLDITESISKRKYEYHYAVVLGTLTNGDEILIEMQKGKGVTLVNKQDFLVKRFKETQIEFEFTPVKLNITREQLIERAKELQFDSYHLLDLNCKIFVEYIVFNIPTPKRVIEFKKIQLGVCDFGIADLKLRLFDAQNEKDKAAITKAILEFEKDKQRLILVIKESEKTSSK